METLFEHDLPEISVESSTISLENMLYDIHYRQHGIRRPGQLDNAVFSDISAAILPKFSIYHYNPESPLLFGPLENNPWYKNDRSLRFIQHVTEFPFEPIGPIMRKPGQAQQYIQAYRRKHRVLKLLRDFFGINRQGNTLVIINYCLLNQLWRYRPHRLVNYYRFMNMYQTIMSTMNKLANQSDRQQFFEIRMPQVLLPRARLRLLSKEYAKGVNTKFIRTFTDDDSWLLFHLWLWLGNTPQYSIFNRIDQKNLSKVNLLLTESGKYTILNLGKINEWRLSGEIGDDEGYEEDTDGDDTGTVDGVDKGASDRLQVRFYKLLQQLFALRTGNLQQIVDVPVYTEQELNDTTPVDDDDEVGETPQTQQSDNPEAIPAQPSSGNVNPEKVGELMDEFITGKKAEPVTDTKGEQMVIPTSPRRKLPTLPDSEPESSDDDVTPSQHAGQPSVPKDIPADTFVAVVDEPESPTYPEEVQTALQSDYSKDMVAEAMEMVEAGVMTKKEYDRVVKLSQRYKTMPSPYDPDQTLEQYTKVSKNDIENIKPTKMPDNDWVLDKSMLEASTEAVRKEYIEKLLPKNIMQSILSIQKGGVLVTDVKRQEVRDPANHYEVLSVEVQPIGKGTAKTVMNIKLPVVSPDGTIRSQNVNYFLTSQRRDVPIRKISPTEVKLTSYYGKLFVSKCERRTFNYATFLVNNVNANVLDGVITDVEYGNVFDQSIKELSPYYGYMAKRFHRFTVREDVTNKIWHCNFNHHERQQLVNDKLDLLTQLEHTYNGTLFAVDETGKQFKFLDSKTNMVVGNDNTVPCTLSSFLQIKSDPPTEMAEVEIFSKSIPIGIIFAYYLGLTNLCRKLNVTPRKVFRGQRMNLTETDYAIKFADETWIFDRRDYQAQLILSGFNHYKRYLEDYSVVQFEEKEVYGAILRDAGLPSQIETEFMLLRRMFIDDITKTLLEQMNEPTEFIPLLFRATELLTTSWSRDEINMKDMMITGYQRIAGQVYTELAKNVKYMHNKVNLQARKRFDMPPNHIFNQIMQDSSMMLVDDINPIHNLKEHDYVVFGGEGGRGKRSMVAHTRQYHVSDLGVISEATVDNQNTGATTFLSSDPNYTSLYGTTESKPIDQLKPSNLLSISAMLGVGSTIDDPKRTTFLSVQNSHTIPIAGSIPSPVRTGYDSCIAHRVDDKFAFVAKEAGKVTEVSDKHMAIKYQSGKTDRVQLGSKYGVSTGHIIHNRLITDYKVGQEVKEGDVVAYNPTHFTRDIFNKSQVLFKNSVLARTVLMESNDTEEDSSAISPRLAGEMATIKTELRTLIIPFTDTIENMVIEGDTVTSETPLCTIIDAVFTDTTMFGEDVVNTLSQLAQNAPKAKHPGVISKIEVLYYGDPEEADISPSVKQLIKRYDYERQMEAKRMQDGRPEVGRLFDTIRIQGTPLPLNHIAVKVYIEERDPMGVGDKGVFSLQLKSVIARVMDGVNETKSGKPIDAIFGYQSISNRIVCSSELIGTTNTLLKLITKEVIDIYRTEKPKK